MRVRIKILDMFLISLLFIFVVSMPFERIVGDKIDLLYALRISFYFLYTLYLFYFLSKYRLLSGLYSRTNWRNVLFLLPTLLVCFNNLIFILFYRDFIFVPSFNRVYIYEIVLTIFTAVIEEILFRYIIHNQLNIKNKLLKILASAGIFALFHIFNFITTFDPSELLRVVYAFGLGIVLGFFIEYGKNTFVCMGYHFLFNFINTNIFQFIFDGVYENMFLTYFLVAITVTIITGLYLLFLYIFKFKKKDIDDYSYWYN